MNRSAPEYQIVTKETFEKATVIRTRFQKGNGKRRAMSTSKKAKMLEDISEQYAEWLGPQPRT